MIRRLLLTVIGALSLAVVSAAQARPPVPLDGVVAIVDDVTLFRSDVAARVRHFESKLPKDPGERRTAIADLTKVMTGRLIDEILITKDAEKLHLVVAPTEVASGIAAVAAANNMDRKQLDAEVASAGYTPAEYEEEVRHQILEQKWLLTRAGGRIDRKKASDPAAFEAAIEKERTRLLRELRTHSYVEIR